MIDNIVEIFLISFLCFRFLHPENLLLQKFDIVVYFWCCLILFASLLTFLCFMWDEETKKRISEKAKKKNYFIGLFMSFVVATLLVLNDFSLCFVFYAIYIFLGFLIMQYDKENK